MNPRLLLAALAAVLALVLPPALRAQVPQLLNYQGRVAVGGVNFNGTGQFAFALVNTNGSVSYWSNDGTSTAGSQPSSAVSLTVTNGLYSLALGDTTLANMTAVPYSVFANSDVRLRVWFNDGVHGWQLLSPDQRLAAVGYAMVANGVASGAVGSTQLAPNLTLGGATSISGDLNLPVTSSANTGVLNIGGAPFLHAYGPDGLSDNNTFLGDSAGNFTLSGQNNTGTGALALFANTTGAGNTATGVEALASNQAGGNNTATGFQALNANTSGIDNTATGAQALIANTAGSYNTASGYAALHANTTGSYSTATGYAALFANSTGTGNSAFGASALNVNSTGGSNTAAGYSALAANVDGSFNTAVGYEALLNSDGSGNTALGNNGLLANTTGGNNTALGASALQAVTTGSNNLGIGANGGLNVITGSNNVYIAHAGVAAENNVIRLGLQGYHVATYVGGIYSASSTDPTATPVFVDQTGHLVTNTAAMSLPAGYVTSAAIANGAVGNTQLATNAVQSGNIASGAVGNSQLAANAVQSGNIASGAVGSSQLAASLTLGGNTTISANLLLPFTTSANSGVLDMSGAPFLHAYGPVNGPLDGNTFLGFEAGNFTMSGTNNTACGFVALTANTSGAGNTACGTSALSTNNSGTANTACGDAALLRNTTGTDNVALGAQTLENNVSASFNTAVGYAALFNNTGSGNTALGNNALLANTTGGNNTALGASTLTAVTTGTNNLGIGVDGGQNVTTGSNNVYIANVGVAAENNVIRIGGQGFHVATYVAAVTGVGVTGTAVVVNSNGQLGVAPSSRRFKQDITDMDQASEAILSLRPVTFHYKPEVDPKAAAQFGLIAEEAAAVNPDLVARDASGAIFTVRYEAVNAMLLNEFLKEHKRVESLRSENAEMKQRLAELEAKDKEHETRLARLEKLLPATAAQEPRATLK